MILQLYEERDGQRETAASFQKLERFDATRDSLEGETDPLVCSDGRTFRAGVVLTESNGSFNIVLFESDTVVLSLFGFRSLTDQSNPLLLYMLGDSRALCVSLVSAEPGEEPDLT